MFAFEVADSNKRTLSKSQLKELHNQINIDPSFGYLIGQPVQIGTDRAVLRVALGAPLIADVATDERLGETLDHRMTWLRQRIRSCFEAIDSLMIGSALSGSTYSESTSL